MKQTEMTAVLLVGGKGSRMGGVEKGRIPFRGKPLLQYSLEATTGFGQRLLSVGEKKGYAPFGLPTIPDVLPGLGPIGALQAGLGASCHSTCLFLACDMPFVSGALIEYLCGYDDAFFDVVLFQTGERLHPLCALYKKRILPLVEEQIKKGDYRLTALLERLRVKRVPLTHSAFTEKALSNVNTPDDLRALEGPVVFGVCGAKNTGKTTLMVGLIREFTGRGFKVATIKHDGHLFEGDTPGTDSYRHKQAGAYASAVFCDRRFSLVADRAVSLEALIGQFDGADVILVEGCKESPHPKLETLRKGVGEIPFCQKGLCALAADFPIGDSPLPVFGLGDYPAIAEFILECRKGEALV